MKRTILLLTIFVIALNRQAGATTPTIIDALNSTFSADSVDTWNVDDVGWLYTPPTSPYTPGSTFTVTDLGTEFGTTSSNVVTVNIYANNNLPGTLGTLIATGTVTPVADQIVFATLNGGAGVTLASGTQYLIAFLGVRGIGENIADDTGVTSLNNWFYYNNNACMIIGGPNSSAHANPILLFGVSNPLDVPEPSLYAMMLLGMAVLFVWKKHSRISVLSKLPV